MDQDQFKRLIEILVRIETRLSKLDRLAAPSEGGQRGFPLGRLVVPTTSTSTSTSTVASSVLAGMPALSNVPVVPQLPPLLNVLEDVQIEGADVLPEVNQSLAQIDITLGSMQNAEGSIQPAPNKVPDVKTAMDSISADVSSTLGKL